MKLSIFGSGKSRLIENRSDDRDNVKLTNAVRDLLNREGRFFGQVTTKDATLTPIWFDAINADSVLHLEATIVGVTAAAAKRGKYVRHQTAYRVGTGVAVLLGGADTIGTDQETDATWDVSVTASGGNVSVNVQGGAADIVTWNARIVALWTPFS